MSRQARDKRRKSVRIELSDRDQTLLRALARFRLAQTTSLTDLVFYGARRDTASRRLRRLFDAGYLRVRSNDLSSENIYSLGPEGIAWLRAQGVQPGRVPRGDPSHHLAIVRTWVDISLAVHERPGVALRLVRPDWEVREGIEDGRFPIIPDALIALQVESVEDAGSMVRLALEVDLGTEPLPVLGSKFRRYETLRTGDGPAQWEEFGLGIYLRDPAGNRMESVGRLLDKLWGGWSVVWTEGQNRRGVLDGIIRAGLASPHGLPLRQGESPERK